MGKGLGSVSGKTCKGLGLDRVDRPNAKRVKGYHPEGEMAGRYGTTRHPTILEQYNRESDYSRWRHGQQYFHGIGQQFSDLEVGVALRLYGNEGYRTVRTVLTLFPSKTSNDFSWAAGRRMRGDLISKVPLTMKHLSLDQGSSDSSSHRLIVDGKELFDDEQFQGSQAQLQIGEQFEDSFIGPTNETPLGGLVGSIALTLVDVDAEEKTLVFDLSRPFGRVGTSAGNMQWSKLIYEPGDPWVFRTERHLGSSHKFYCTCPDFSGSMLANTQSTAFQSEGRRFPLPPASRAVRGDYEAEMVGFEKRWRDLPLRSDERRECKHIHCLRWQMKAPWREPNDSPIGGSESLIHSGESTETDSFGNKTFEAYTRNRTLDWQNVSQAVAGALGYNLSPVGDMAQRSDRPQLWMLEQPPEVGHCRLNDLWLKRSTKQLHVCDGKGGWSQSLPDENGDDAPIVTVMSDTELKAFVQSN